MTDKPRNELKEYNGLVRLRRKDNPIEDGLVPVVIDWRKTPHYDHGNGTVN